VILVLVLPATRLAGNAKPVLEGKPNWKMSTSRRALFVVMGLGWGAGGFSQY
jgi:hypothetical protein